MLDQQTRHETLWLDDGNVVLVTNMWSEVTPERGAAREHELRTDRLLFAPVLECGAEMLRHDGTLAGAQAVLAHLAGNTPRTLAIQRELVDEHMDIADTAAGVELDRELAALRAQHVAQLAEIQQEMEDALAAKDEQTRAELDAVRGELLQNIEKIEGDRDRLSREFADEKAKADETEDEKEKKADSSPAQPPPPTQPSPATSTPEHPSEDEEVDQLISDSDEVEDNPPGEAATSSSSKPRSKPSTERVPGKSLIPHSRLENILESDGTLTPLVPS